LVLQQALDVGGVGDEVAHDLIVLVGGDEAPRGSVVVADAWLLGPAVLVAEDLSDPVGLLGAGIVLGRRPRPDLATVETKVAPEVVGAGSTGHRRTAPASVSF
jgi:hypothetical protein